MLGQGKCQGYGNKGHNEIACDIFVKKLIRYTEKKNDGLEKHYINNKQIYYIWLNKYMIMLPVKGPVKTLIPIQVFFKEDKNIIHNDQDLQIK